MWPRNLRHGLGWLLRLGPGSGTWAGRHLCSLALGHRQAPDDATRYFCGKAGQSACVAIKCQYGALAHAEQTVHAYPEEKRRVANHKAHDVRRPYRLQETISNRYANGRTVTLVTQDAVKFMKTLPDEIAQLVVTSPPYNIGKAYEKRTTMDQYLASMRPVIAECIRILKPGGSICWQVGYHVDNGRSINLAFEFYPEFKKYEQDGIVFRNAIVWHFEHGLHASKRFSGRYETVLWFTKGDDYVFNLDDVRVPQKYPGKRHFKGTKKGEYSGNPLGKNPGDVWIDIPNVKANHVEKTDHPCQFPVTLVERLVRALTREGELVVDPFMGVGTTAVAAIRNRRSTAGCDLVSKYIATARRRVRLALTNQLRIREEGPIHVPLPNTTLTRFPETFRRTEPDAAALMLAARPLE